jgi:hypothetical protein
MHFPGGAPAWLCRGLGEGHALRDGRRGLRALAAPVQTVVAGLEGLKRQPVVRAADVLGPGVSDGDASRGVELAPGQRPPETAGRGQRGVRRAPVHRIALFAWPVSAVGVRHIARAAAFSILLFGEKLLQLLRAKRNFIMRSNLF